MKCCYSFSFLASWFGWCKSLPNMVFNLFKGQARVLFLVALLACAVGQMYAFWTDERKNLSFTSLNFFLFLFSICCFLSLRWESFHMLTSILAAICFLHSYFYRLNNPSYNSISISVFLPPKQHWCCTDGQFKLIHRFFLWDRCELYKWKQDKFLFV